MAYPLQNYQQNNQMNPSQFRTFTPPPSDQSWLSQFFFGTPESYTQIPRYGQQGMDFLSQLLSGSSNQLNNPYQGFDDIANYAKQQFFQDIIPQLSEQFTSMGGRGTAAASSPAFASQLGQAGSGLAGILGAQKQQYGFQNRQQALQQGQLGLTQPYDIQGNNRVPGFPESLLGNFNQNAQTAAKMLPFLF